MEVAAPIYDQGIRERIRRMFDIMMTDDEKGKEQNSAGEYCDRLLHEPKLNSQEIFYQEAYDCELG